MECDIPGNHVEEEENEVGMNNPQVVFADSVENESHQDVFSPMSSLELSAVQE